MWCNESWIFGLVDTLRTNYSCNIDLLLICLRHVKLDILAILGTRRCQYLHLWKPLSVKRNYHSRIYYRFNLWVSGNPAMRQGKPGSGVGFGYGLRFKSPVGHFQVDYAINAFQQKTLYFGVTNLASWIHFKTIHKLPNFFSLCSGKRKRNDKIGGRCTLTCWFMEKHLKLCPIA